MSTGRIVPRMFVGAWEREALEIAGRPVTGIGRAWWIEAGGTYVDVRAPGSVASGTSFGGRSRWRAPTFTWHHDLDLHPRPQTIDRGVLSRHEDRIVERGTGIDGDCAPYEERWRRLPSAGRSVAIATHVHGLAVRVGDHAAVIIAGPAPGSRSARAWQHSNGRWSEVMALGAPAELPEPGASGWQVTNGWSAR